MINVEDFIRRMPKVELGLRFEGAIQKQTLLRIAEQNEVMDKIRRFNDWVTMLDKPDFKRLDEIIRMTATWWEHPEDFSRMTYDIGVMLHKENVKYAEVLINPSLLLPQNNLSIDELLEAIADGRDRAYRAWGIQLEWILVAPREEPRKFEELVRWATSSTVRRNSVLAVGLVGQEEILSPNPFERSVQLALKKDLPIVVQAGHIQKADGILQALSDFSPARLLDAWGLADAPDAIQQILERDIAVVTSLGRALCSDWVKTYANYPMASLYQQGIKPIISADMPSYYKTTLNDEYMAVVNHCKLSLDALQELGLNAVAMSFLPPTDKASMIEVFASEYAHLREDVSVGETE